MNQKIIFLLSTMALLFMISSCKEDEGCTNELSFNYNPNAEKSDGSCLDMHGCLGYTGGMSNSGEIANSFGNAYYDQKMQEELYIQRSFFSPVNAAFFVLLENSPAQRNAWATSDGRILFGRYMLEYIVNSYGELPVAGVLAHEFGHIAQNTYGWQYSRPEYKELEADAFSGFYMALAKQWAWENIQSYYDNVYATGDYAYNSPHHHGTPNERLNSAYLGVQVAVNALQNGTQYSYQELHNVFLNEIKNNIAPRSSQIEFEEIVYPKGLTKEYIESLYPKE